ncbi:MAG: hypothetical protein JST26_06750 [Bacteroidetes bacterium]|nr:hypothetical protein [Bacteroidota bacterium]
MLQITKQCLVILSVSALLFSCNGSKNEDNEIADNNDSIPESVAIDSTRISAQNVFNSIPGRAEIVALAAEAKSEYNFNILSNPDDVNKYTVESSKALNLGAYGSDLSTAGVYEQTQESMVYLKCVNILAKQLGVSSAFDEKMVDRMEANKENRDSTLEIITQSFKNADNFLKANGRPGTSSLIVAGGWIEGMYIACNTAKETKNENVIKTIFKQKESLRNLIDLLEKSKVSADAGYVTVGLKEIKTLLDAKNDNVYTLDSIKDIFAKTEALRKKIVAPN